MTAESVLSFLFLCILSSLVMMVGFAFRRRRDELEISSLLSRVQRPIVQATIIATDADLKVEFLFFSYVAGVVLVTSLFRGQAHDNFVILLGLVALIQGYTLRQWLSKWRFRNIVFVGILHRDRSVYIRGAGEVAAVAINNVVMWWLLWTLPSYALFQVAGFLVHEVLAEVKKRRLLLRRKLHLFDLEFVQDANDRDALIRAVDRFKLSAVDRLIDKIDDRKQRTLLMAFKMWLRNDFDGMDKLLLEERGIIDHDPRLLYYFGKALYAQGRIDKAAELLALGHELDDPGCRAYLILCQLAQDRSAETLTKITSSLRSIVPRHCASRAEMFLAAYYALSLAIYTGRTEDADRAYLRESLYFIHEAMRANQKFYEARTLGPLSMPYFDANNQIFIDIYGYIVFRQGNLQMSFRVLESAIMSDNTYPWPYFHIALIYDRIGRVDRAHALYYRIAVNEVSDTVLRRLCQKRLARLTEPGDKSFIETATPPAAP